MTGNSICHAASPKADSLGQIITYTMPALHPFLCYPADPYWLTMIMHPTASTHSSIPCCPRWTSMIFFVHLINQESSSHELQNSCCNAPESISQTHIMWATFHSRQLLPLSVRCHFTFHLPQGACHITSSVFPHKMPIPNTKMPARFLKFT